MPPHEIGCPQDDIQGIPQKEVADMQANHESSELRYEEQKHIYTDLKNADHDIHDASDSYGRSTNKTLASGLPWKNPFIYSYWCCHRCGAGNREPRTICRNEHCQHHRCSECSIIKTDGQSSHDQVPNGVDSTGP